MKQRSGILLVLVATCGAFGAKVCTAAEPQNPYPWGKAEIKAKGIQDVVELLRFGHRYRDRCTSLAESKQPFSAIEQCGIEAKAWYRAVLENEPSNSYASLCLGYIDLILGRATTSKTAKEDRFSAAMSRFREALENRPGYARAYLLMAQVHTLTERYAEAEKNLRLVLNSNIEDSEIHSWMAYLLLKTDRPSEAHKHLVRAIELDDPSPSARWSREHQK